MKDYRDLCRSRQREGGENMTKEQYKKMLEDKIRTFIEELDPYISDDKTRIKNARGAKRKNIYITKTIAMDTV